MPGSRRYTRRTTAERQRQIAEATLRLVAKYGVHGATVSRIAAAVGLSRAALYKHFPNQAAVLRAALDLMIERSPSWLSRSAGTTVLERLKNMGACHASWASSEFETFIHPLFQFAAASNGGELTKEIGERHLMFVQAFAELIEEGKREGSIRQDVDTEVIAWGMMMFAWAEDVARLVGVDQLITSGISVKVFERLLAGIGNEPEYKA